MTIALARLRGGGTAKRWVRDLLIVREETIPHFPLRRTPLGKGRCQLRPAMSLSVETRLPRFAGREHPSGGECCIDAYAHVRSPGNGAEAFRFPSFLFSPLMKLAMLNYCVETDA